MRKRNISFIIVICFEIALILFLAFAKFNHCLAGYIGLGLCVCLFLVTIWIMLFPKAKSIDPTGEHEVATKNITLVDETRLETYIKGGSKRTIQVKFWYPKDINKEKPCSLVVFSHGSFGNVDNNETLMKELASRGYVAASIGHTYMASKVVINERAIKMSPLFRKEVTSINPEKNKELALKLYSKWMNITSKDVCFAINQIKESSDEINKIIDTSKICVMGHSFGGSTALAVGRIRYDISAVIALESPFMYDVKSIKNNRFVFDENEYPTRMLNIYSDSSFSRLSKWDQYAQNYRYLEVNNPKYKNVYLKGLGHMHLCDFQLASPFLSWIFSGVDSKNNARTNLKAINKIVLDYFKEINF